MGRISDARKKARQKKSVKGAKPKVKKALKRTDVEGTTEKTLATEDVPVQSPPVSQDVPAKKAEIILPHSGLAKDILGKRDHSTADLKKSAIPKKKAQKKKKQGPEKQQKLEKSIEATKPEQLSAASPDEDAPPTKGIPSTDPEEHTGPDQIYSFADDLDRSRTTDELSGKKKAEKETWVTFNLSGEAYGLPVSHVKEILRTGTITPVPYSPCSVLGIINNRGKLLTVVSLRVMMGLDQVDSDIKSRILVTESKNRLIGLLVDSVRKVIRLDRDDIQPAPPDVMTDRSDYITGVYNLEEALVIMLDVDRVLVIKDFQHNTTVEEKR